MRLVDTSREPEACFMSRTPAPKAPDESRRFARRSEVRQPARVGEGIISDTFLLARIANRGAEESLADYDLDRMSTALQPLAERLIVAGHRERQLQFRKKKQTSNFRGAERGRTDSAARILRNQPESAHSGV
jgi:hypothetical protein